MTYPELYMVIDGERVRCGGRRKHDVVNPATGDALAALSEGVESCLVTEAVDEG